MAQGSHGTTHETHRRKSCNDCGDYSVPQLARNNYFTGKLLVERDFTDEQRYHAGKQQRHNRHLHGSGCVCGLKVKQHHNENCRDQYVVIEPGTAIDCCGRELLVTQKEYFDFSAKIAEKKAGLGDDPHTLQICLRYSECPTEQIPVLFDDCADGTTTQPNRIMEGYDFDVRINPVSKRKALDDVDLDYQQAVSITNAHRIAVDEAGQRLYVLTSGDASTLLVYNTDDTYSAGTPQTLDGQALDIALSLDGSRIYVSMRHKNSVRVYDAKALGTPAALVNELPAHSTPSGDVRLAVSPRDGFLYVLDTHRRTVTLWKPSINHKNEDIDDAMYGHIRVGEAPHSIVASPDGRWVLVANSGDKTISVIDATIHTHHPVTINLNKTIPTEMAIATTDDGLKLYILDGTNNTVSILLLALRADPPFIPLGMPHSLTGTLIGIAASYSGRWLYALLTDATGKGRIQVIDAHKVERGEAYADGDWLTIGKAPCQLVLIPTRPHMYVAYHGSETEAGGVAVVHLLETTCEDFFKHALHDCDDCDEDDECIVLATINNYTVDMEIVDDEIDNFTDRRLLPSTDLITDVVRCILDNGGGKGRRGEEGPQGKEGRGIEAVRAHIIDADDEAKAFIEEIDEKRTLVLDIPHGRKGERGEEGPHGKAGRSIEAVRAHIVDCHDKGKASIEEIDEKRTLVLEIPRGCDGRDAELPPPVQYTRICAINWKHRGRMEREDLEDGLLIAFNRKIRFGDVNSQTFQVLTRTEDQEGLVTWRELPHRHLLGIELELNEGPHGTCSIVGRKEESYHHADSFVNGAVFQLKAIPEGAFTLRIVLKGDLIQDEQGLGVDGNHLPPWLPNRPSGDGVEGGTFESWFTVEAGETEEDREARVAREAEVARAAREALEARQALEAKQARTSRRSGERRDGL